MSRITPFSGSLVFRSAARLHDTLVERTWTGRMQDGKNESDNDFIFKFKGISSSKNQLISKFLVSNMYK